MPVSILIVTDSGYLPLIIDELTRLQLGNGGEDAVVSLLFGKDMDSLYWFIIILSFC